MKQRIWRDRKRILGLPIGLTEYSLDNDRLYIRRGLLNLTDDEVQLFRIQDFRVEYKLIDRIFGVGDIIIKSTDRTSPTVKLENVKYPSEVKELLYEKTMEARKRNRVSCSCRVCTVWLFSHREKRDSASKSLGCLSR